MKKTFYSVLRTMCVGAMTLFAVSCYDDSALWGEIDRLDSRVDSLATALNGQVATINTTLGTLASKDAELLQKLTDLDAKLVAEVAKLAAELDRLDGKFDGYVTTENLTAQLDALKETINANYTELKGVDTEILAALTKLAVTKVEKNAAGNVLLTFVDGSTLEVGAADANANNTGLVTVVDGKWAVVGADGQAKVLDAEVHPDTNLEFQVDPETKELLYSLDGATWEKTGAYVGEEKFHLVTDFVDCDTYVKITVGGVEYNLPKVSTNRFEILSGMVFFEAGATKTIPVRLDGVVSSMVAKIPAGWSAEIVGGALEVTAPADESGAGDDYVGDDMGGIMPMSAAVTETYGTVEIWAVTESGKTFVGTLVVSISDAFAKLTVKADSVFVTIPSEEIMDWDEDWNQVPTGEYTPIYFPVFYGACEVEEFDGAALMNTLNYWAVGEDEKAKPGIRGNYTLDEEGYPEWLAETKASLADLLGAAPEVGKTYVVWAFDRNAFEYENSDATFVKAYYTPSKVTVEEPVATWKDATLAVSIEGLDQFYALVVEKDAYDYYVSDEMEGPWTDSYLETLRQWGMYTFYDMFMPGNVHYSPGAFFDGEYTGQLSKLGLDADSEEFNEFAPGQELVLCVLPIDPSKTKADYSLADLVVKEFALKGLAYNGTATVEFGDAEAKYTSFTLPMTSNGAVSVGYTYMKTDAYEALVAGLEDGETIQDYMMDNFGDLYQTKDAKADVYAQSLAKGTSYIVAAIAVDADGKVSQVVTKEVKTPDYPYDRENLAIEVVSVTFTEGAAPVTVVYRVTGAENIVVNASFGTPSLRNGATHGATVESNLMNYGPAHMYLKNLPVAEDGTVSVTYNSYYGSTKYSYAVAYTLDEKDNITALSPAHVTDLSTYLPAAE